MTFFKTYFSIFKILFLGYIFIGILADDFAVLKMIKLDYKHGSVRILLRPVKGALVKAVPLSYSSLAAPGPVFIQISSWYLKWYRMLFFKMKCEEILKA